MEQILISVVVITYNEAAKVERCLRSVLSIADELIVVDSLSTDETREIATRLGARVVQQVFLGYKEQKNFATLQARHKWVLNLDADETLDEALLASIQKFKAQNPDFVAYKLPRTTQFCGQWIKHSGWFPDHQIRLYDKTKGEWQGLKIHEKWQPFNKSPLGRLNGSILHYSFDSLTDYHLQQQKFALLAAESNKLKGYRPSWFKIWVSPVFKFMLNYLLRLGFLDGRKGLQVCFWTAYYTHLKYRLSRQ